MNDETISNIGSLIVTAGVVVGGLLVVGLVLLFRNRDGAKPSAAAGLAELRKKANVRLVLLDETLASADNELGFAVAQFGEEKTQDYALAVQQARTMATAAFRARQQLDDAFPEPVTKQRELTLQIIALCEVAQDTLDKEQASFSTLRTAEVEAPESLATLRAAIAAAHDRLAPASATLKRLAAAYRPDIAAEHAKAIADAKTQLEEASTTVTAAEKALSPSGVNAVTNEVKAAELSLSRATTLLDAIDTTEHELDAAASTLTGLITSTRKDLTEARRQRESAPDPDTGSAIIAAIERVETVLAGIAADKKPSDPIANLDKLNAAVAELDTALASARNQTQRLEHARTALTGTLVSARSQLAATRGFIAAGAGRVGADARMRLSEAEREFTNAQAEADPVAALDAARRAVTSAQDADALARYDAMKTFRS